MTTTFAKALVYLMSAECLAAAVAFAWTGHYRVACYWLLASGINFVAGGF